MISARDLTSQFVLHLPNGFKPHVDAGTSDPFLPKDPWQMLRSGDFNHVPMIHGYNLYDNAFMVAPLLQQPHRFKQLEEEWEELAALFMFSRLAFISFCFFLC